MQFSKVYTGFLKKYECIGNCQYYSKEFHPMNKEEFLKSLEKSMMELNEDDVIILVKKAISNKIDPYALTASMANAMEAVGEKYSRGECFIPELIFCGQIFTKAMEIIEPEMEGKEARKGLGKVVIGTVRGDLHDLGVKLVSLTLTMGGFEVFNLGRDVPVETFIEKVKEMNPAILGLSALLTTTMSQQKEVIEALKVKNLRDKVKIMIGGAPVTKEWAEAIGADAVGFDAIDALKKAKRLIGMEAV